METRTSSRSRWIHFLNNSTWHVPNFLRVTVAIFLPVNLPQPSTDHITNSFRYPLSLTNQNQSKYLCLLGPIHRSQIVSFPTVPIITPRSYSTQFQHYPFTRFYYNTTIAPIRPRAEATEAEAEAEAEVEASPLNPYL